MTNKITLETDNGRKFEVGIEFGVDELGAELREELRAVLVEKGYLLEKDGLKTNMILQRY